MLIEAKLDLFVYQDWEYNNMMEGRFIIRGDKD